jgi:hypothetical protein
MKSLFIYFFYQDFYIVYDVFFSKIFFYDVVFRTQVINTKANRF